MNRTAGQATLAELAWKQGTADGEDAARRPGNGEAVRQDVQVLAPRIASADLQGLARQAGGPGTPENGPDDTEAWEEARALAADAYASAYARAFRGEEDAVSQRVRYLPGWPVDTGNRTGYLAGPATPDGHPHVLFEDGSEETLPRAAITGAVVFLIEEGDPVTLPAASGDIVVSPARHEALAVSAGTLVPPDPELARPGTPHEWTDLLYAALLDQGLKNGRALESFIHSGFTAATEARNEARAQPTAAAEPEPPDRPAAARRPRGAGRSPAAGTGNSPGPV